YGRGCSRAGAERPAPVEVRPVRRHATRRRNKHAAWRDPEYRGASSDLVRRGSPAPLKAPLILIGIYCGLGGCDFLASALLFITGGVPLPCDPVDLPFLAKVACGRLAFYSTALKL